MNNIIIDLILSETMSAFYLRCTGKNIRNCLRDEYTHVELKIKKLLT